MRLSTWSKSNSRETKGIEGAEEVGREVTMGDEVVIGGEVEEVVEEGGVEEGGNDELAGWRYLFRRNG